jgi:hypothetical protein
LALLKNLCEAFLLKPSRYPQIGNLDENTSFQTGINNVIFSVIMMWMIEIWTNPCSAEGIPTAGLKDRIG